MGDANETYITDESIRRRMLEKNPDALRDMVETFLEAANKGHWDTSEENLERLRDVYQECEDRIEGVDFTSSAYGATDACGSYVLERSTWILLMSVCVLSRSFVYSPREVPGAAALTKPDGMVCGV